MNTDRKEKEVEVIKQLECGRFKVTVSQIKMSAKDREIENSRIRKQFIMARI